MARRLRLQFEGAIYHVINRGNYRRDIFVTESAANAFLATLGQACARYGFRVHGYVVMSNHYHLALETPQANLVEGMHWLQSTFCSRFNRFRRVRGHLFQGRYQALLVEDTSVLARVIDYIHLNPVRAKLVTPETILSFSKSSLPWFINGSRPVWLTPADLLKHNGLDDTTTGWAQYVASLTALARDSSEQERRGFSKLSRGWAIGTRGWREAPAKDHAHLALDPDIPRAELREIKEARWRAALELGMNERGKLAADIAGDPKGARWKIEVAIELRTRVGAPHRWIAEQLNMGSPAAVRVNVARFS
jgi:putative transposase